MVGQKLILSGLSKACSGLGGVGEGLGEGVWRQEEGVSCRKLAQEVWASQQEKEQADREAEEVFTDAVNFAAIHVMTIHNMQFLF